MEEEEGRGGREGGEGVTGVDDVNLLINLNEMFCVHDREIFLLPCQPVCGNRHYDNFVQATTHTGQLIQ